MLMLLVQILILIPVLLVGLAVFNLALRFVRALERRGTDQSEFRSLQERFERLEEELGRIAIQVERLEEGQLFTQRLLGEQRSGIPPVS